MLCTDLRELKLALEIDPNNTTEDRKLWLFIRWASSWIGELLNRPDFSLQFRTEYYQGTGTQRLLLRNRPVFPMVDTDQQITVWSDPNGYYGATSGAFTPPDAHMVYGVDFALQIDQPDGSSRSGILIRINDYWYKPYARQAGLLSPFITQDNGSIKVQYLAGYTVDSLPANFRMAVELLVARIRMIMPLGAELNSEGYEERSISVVTSEKSKLLALVKPLILPYRNWRW